MYKVLLTVKCLSSVWGSFSAFPIFGYLISQKPVFVKQKGQKFQPQRQVFSACRVLLTVKFSLGSFGAFPGFDDLVATFELNIQGSLYC